MAEETLHDSRAETEKMSKLLAGSLLLEPRGCMCWDEAQTTHDERPYGQAPPKSTVFLTSNWHKEKLPEVTVTPPRGACSSLGVYTAGEFFTAKPSMYNGCFKSF